MVGASNIGPEADEPKDSAPGAWLNVLDSKVGGDNDI